MTDPEHFIRLGRGCYSTASMIPYIINQMFPMKRGALDPPMSNRYDERKFYPSTS